MARKMKNSGIEWIGVIPEDWKLGRVKHGFIRKKQEAHQDNPVILSLARAGVHVRDISNNEGQIAESYYNYNVVSPGDLLLNPMDLYSGANCSISKVGGVISPAYVNLGAKEGFHSAYYDYFFKTQYWAMVLFAHGKGVSFDNRWTLSNEDLMNYRIPIPSFSEQSRIASYLDVECSHINCVIEHTKASIEEYKKLKQAIITQAVTKGVHPNRQMKSSGIEWIGDICSDWSLQKIKTIISKVGSGKTPLGGAESYMKDGVLFLRSQNVYDDGLVLDNPTFITEKMDEEMKSTRVEPEDVLLNITGGSIGRCCIFPSNLGRANVNQHVSIIRVKKSFSLPEYMHYYWLSRLGHMSIQLFQTGGNREGMTADAIKNTLIPLPEVNEQKEIVEYLNEKCSAINNLIVKKEQILTNLEAYRKTLIFECVTGKKEVV